MADRPADKRDRTLAEAWDGLDHSQQQQVTGDNDKANVDAMLQRDGCLRLAQLPPPGDWAIWAILAGRGFGKTRAGAEWIHALAAAPSWIWRHAPRSRRWLQPCRIRLSSSET